ncbi:MAG: type II toxin-antitoxin system RelE/ParE family toxin [Chitinophagales bacterium]
MAKRAVVWTRTADIQFVGILKYWVERNNSNVFSKKLVKLVAERTRDIAERPKMYKATDYKDIRVASLGNFSIFFKVTIEEIIITAFWDNRQDPKKLLKILERNK